MNRRGHPVFAALYDRLSRTQEQALFGPIREGLLRGVTGKILDVGAGTGANLPYYSAESVVTAVEPDPYMRKRGEGRPSPAAVTWVEGAAEDLPFPDASFDAVVFTLVLCSVASVEKSLSEARRVLRSGGRLLFLEHVASERYQKLQHLINPLWKRINAGCNLNRDTLSHIKSAGFRVERLERKMMSSLVPVIHGHSVKD